MVDNQTQAEYSLFPVRLDQSQRWMLDKLAEMQGRTRGGLIKHLIKQEAKRAKIKPPEETKNAATQ